MRRPEYWFDELRWGRMHKEVAVSPRIATHLVGMGRLEAVPERALFALRTAAGVAR